MGRRLYRAPVATTIARAVMVRPSASSTLCSPPTELSAFALEPTRIAAENFSAWSEARAASSAPDRPAGNPR